MASPEAPPASRVAAAQVLLDRGWGKPEQHLDVDQTVTTGVPSAEPMTDEAWQAKHGPGAAKPALINGQGLSGTPLITAETKDLH